MTISRRFPMALVAAAIMLFSLPARVSETEPADEGREFFYLSDSNVELDVPFVPTPQAIVEEMLKLAQVRKRDVVYDLGCGDGRIVITAARKYGARGVGVDLDPDRVKESQENAKKRGVGKLVEIRQGDVLRTDVSEATVVTLYLLPEVNLKLRPILEEQLKPGSRIVSHDFDMGDWEPEKVVHLDYEGSVYTIYLWRIPEAAGGKAGKTARSGRPAEAGKPAEAEAGD